MIGYYFDFDSTLSPIDADRGTARQTSEALEMLRYLSKRHVVAVKRLSLSY